MPWAESGHVGAFRCVLDCLLQSAVSLQPLFAAAGARAPHEAASAQLRSLAAGPLMQAAPSMARFVGEGSSSMPDGVQQVGGWSLLSFLSSSVRTAA